MASAQLRCTPLPFSVKLSLKAVRKLFTGFKSMQLKMASTSSTSLNAVISMYQNLIKEWNKKPPNLEAIGKLLTSMKVSTSDLN